MSLFRTEHLFAALCPDEVAIRVICGGRGASGVMIETASAAPEDAPRWQGAVDALAGMLARLPVRRGVFGGHRQVSLLLSDRLLRYALLPWSDTVRRPAHWQALAQACCENLYGEMSAWTMRIDPGDYGTPQLACAVETALLSSLRNMMEARGIVCPQVVPYFAVCWNRWRRRIGESEALFAVHDAGTTVVAMRRQNQWHSLRMLGGVVGGEALPGLLRREALLQGGAGPICSYVHMPGTVAPATDEYSLLVPDEVVVAATGVAATMVCVGANA